MKKFGFTLAEVLVALGIIGVIASLTAPTFISNIRNTTNASRLSATVATLENAFTTMLAKEDVDTEELLYDTDAWENIANPNAFAGNIGNYLSLETFRREDIGNITEYYGANNGPFGMTISGARGGNFRDTMENANANLSLKNGATVFLTAFDNDAPDANTVDGIKALGGSLYSKAADVWIDVNGTDAPNTWGRDIFKFYLGHNGKLYPVGGRDAAVIDNNADGLLWNGANGNRRCTDNNIQGSGLGCAARVVEENYKINY